jgi:hypothetical protein
MEVFCNYSRQEPFISELLFVEIIDQEQDFDDILFYDFCFESWNFGSHLSLQQLHKNR